jgi:putative DNA primase/helicase
MSARRSSRPSVRRDVDFGRVNTAALATLPALLECWLPGGRREGDEYLALNPKRTDHSLGSFRINIATGAWADFALGDARGGDLVSLFAYLHDLGQGKAALALARELKLPEHARRPAAPRRQRKAVPIIPVPADAPRCAWKHPKHGAPTALWAYRTAAGELVAYAARLDFEDNGKPAKDVLPLAFCDLGDGKRGWRAAGIPEPRPLFGLDRLAARPDAPVIVVEGEKKAEAAEALFPDHVAVTSLGGCRAARKTDWAPLARRNVTIWPDHDVEGAAYAADVARIVHEVGAASVRIVCVPSAFPLKWDLADALPSGVSANDLRALLDGAEAAVPRPAESRQDPLSLPSSASADAALLTEEQIEAEIARLAGLSQIAYEREREGATKKTGLRSSILEKLVAAARKDAAPRQGRALDLAEPEPWPEPVNGADLLTEVSEAIQRHVIIADAPRDAVALWCVAVHAFRSFNIFPRLLLTAPTKQAGKSTLLDTIERFVPRPLTVSGATAAALFRAIPVMRPVLLLDEADAWARDSEDVRAVIDAGHKSGGMVLRCVGDDSEPRAFDVFAPAALAAIGRLPDTIEDRSITVPLQRKMPNETVLPLRAGLDALSRLARQAARWACDHALALSKADPPMPAGLANRAADNWAPLLAVADAAGGYWPARARRAAAALTGGEDQSRAAMLFADIRRVFAEVGQAVDRMTSEVLAARLAEIEDRPWAEFRNGRPITKAQLARMLRGFGIFSGSIRLADGSTPKGYHREAFIDAFARYLPKEPPVQNATTPQSNSDGHFRDFSKRHTGQAGEARGVSGTGGNPNNDGHCGDVAFSEPLAPGEIKTWTR